MSSLGPEAFVMRILAVVFALAVVARGAGPDNGSAVVKPLNLERLNSPHDEDEPHLATSALQLHYATNAGGKWQTRVSQRRGANQPWPPGTPLPDLQGKAESRSVYVTREGVFPQRLYFATNMNPEGEDGKGDNFDVYFLIRQSRQADWTMPTPVHAVCSEADELHPWLTADSLQLFFSRKDEDGWHVYAAKRTTPKEQFGKATLIDLPKDFHHATLTPDGRIMYLQGKLDKGHWGLFRSMRTSTGWAEPEPVKKLNHREGLTGDRSPNLSRDGSFLYFASDRPGGKGGLDLYVVRTALLGKK